MRTGTKTKVKISDIEKRAKAFFPRRRHEQGAELCLIIDGMNIAYQAKAAYRKLSHKGKSTSMLFGVPTIINSIMKRYKAHKVVVCWDGEKHPKRLELFPGYKSHREKSREPGERSEMYDQVKKVRKLLYAMGIPQILNKKMEGDDAIYWAWKKYLPLYRIVIATADKDMHQLINLDTTIYNPRTQIPYSNFAYVCDNLVEPYQFIDYLCLVGDSSDDLPGYRGIGPSKAAQFFRLFKGIGEYLKSKEDFSGMTDKENLREVWKRNRMMIDLQRFNEKYHKMEDATFYKGKAMPKFDQVLFNTICGKYRMNTFLKDTFQKPFKDLQNA
jgi:DNA polymerase I